ncbi:ABC transporter ATP-binding protein [Brevibacterium samyangense]
MTDTRLPLLQIESLRVEAFAPDGSRTRILDDIDLEVHPGEPMGLVGESGSGKSMTLRAVLGLLPPSIRVTGGRICFEGRDILTSGPRGGYDTRVRGAGISMVFQEPAIALNPVMKVGRQITDAVALRQGMTKKAARKRAIELMDQVGIVDAEHRVDSYPFELSGGMRQRVMIAAAIAQQPKLLLCDEPTTALDVTIQAQVVDLFRTTQHESGLGLLYVTHDLAVVSQMCTSLTVMRHGNILEHGALQSIFDAPAHDYTRALLTATPRLPEDTLTALGTETRA